MTKEKRLLILGAGRGQLGLYKAAKKLGYYVIAGTLPNAYKPSLSLADEEVTMDISSPDQVYEKSKDLMLDGVATCSLDTGLHSLGRLCDKLDLIGITEKSSRLCSDKLKMKEAFMQEGVSTAKYYKLENENDLTKALEDLTLPVIVKATDLQGSNGIYIARSKQEAYDGFKNAMEKTKRSYVIVEEFIEGEEFGAQAFIYKGEVLFVMPHGDETFMSHTAVPVGHYIPYEASKEVYQQIVETSKAAMKALNLDNCAVNIDLILRDGKVYVIELTGRVGANCLPELVEINYGIEYYRMIAKMAVGENPIEDFDKRNDENKASYAKMLFSTELAGQLKEDISYDGKANDDIVEMQFFVNKGDIIRKFENSNDCIGQVIVKGESLEYCQDLLDDVINNINYRV